MQNIGGPELIVLGIIVLLLFGTNKLKELARGLGHGIREFNDIKKEFEDPLGEKKETPGP